MLLRFAIAVWPILSLGDDRVIVSISSVTARRLIQGPVPPEGPPTDWVDVRTVPAILSSSVGDGRRLSGVDSDRLERCLAEVEDMLAIGMQWVDTGLATCSLSVAEFCGFLEGLGEDYEVICEENGELRIVQSDRFEPETFELPISRVSYLANDDLVESQWNLDEIRLGEAWEMVFQEDRPAREIVVAVVDTGVEYDHPDLIDGIFSDADCRHGHNFFDADLDPRDVNGHGTHCAGILGATTNNARGLAGIAPVKIMSLRAFDEMGKGDLLYSLQAVNYIVTRRVEVSSHSYTSDGTYRTLEAAMKRASDRGHLMFAAAGNDGRDITIAKTYPCAYSQTVEYLLCVGSTDMYARNRLARESNFGRYVDIAAPGVGIPSTYIGNIYSYMSGTSMATPHIAGIAALLSGLGLGPADIKEVLLASTDPVYYFGGNRVGNFGKVNAARAVELALTKPTVIDTASSNCNATREEVCQYLADAAEALNIGAICRWFMRVEARQTVYE
ncbi:Suppressor of the cold-sensitive snRNP bioproteinsis mutant brr1-1 [Perkinsus olseni]|uniref:subtilisin n=2 Tax=Perkinsus olseni TaxID=32597 RepID=A0A7J6PDP0_PEROL|nr:Suppressor of the cold-sensitive snRNP bioproteinsis mutant brr1-1 [Perkinsus olseni]